MSDQTVSEKRPPRDVFCGWTENDVYVTLGHHYGPGVAKDVPAEHADHLEEAIRYVQSKRDKAERIEPTNTGAVRPVALHEATDEELMAIMAQRGLVQPTPDPPVHTDDGGALTPDEIKALEENQKKIDAENKQRDVDAKKSMGTTVVNKLPLPGSQS